MKFNYQIKMNNSESEYKELEEKLGSEYMAKVQNVDSKLKKKIWIAIRRWSCWKIWEGDEGIFGCWKVDEEERKKGWIGKVGEIEDRFKIISIVFLL